MKWWIWMDKHVSCIRPKQMQTNDVEPLFSFFCFFFFFFFFKPGEKTGQKICILMSVKKKPDVGCIFHYINFCMECKWDAFQMRSAPVTFSFAFY